tara:strand:+ start:235 stop:2598 length:2364 start_codon:yes stop_codon:yes gene_type:complete
MSSVELLSQKPNPPERPSLTADQSEWDAYVTAGKQFKLDMKEYTRIRKNDTSNRCKQNKKLKLAQSADPQPAVALQQQGSKATLDSQSSIALLQPPISSVATESRAVLRLDASNTLSLSVPSVFPWPESQPQAAQQVLPHPPELLLSSRPMQPVPPSPELSGSIVEPNTAPWYELAMHPMGQTAWPLQQPQQQQPQPSPPALAPSPPSAPPLQSAVLPESDCASTAQPSVVAAEPVVTSPTITNLPSLSTDANVMEDSANTTMDESSIVVADGCFDDDDDDALDFEAHSSEFADANADGTDDMAANADATDDIATASNAASTGGRRAAVATATTGASLQAETKRTTRRMAAEDARGVFCSTRLHKGDTPEQHGSQRYPSELPPVERPTGALSRQHESCLPRSLVRRLAETVGGMLWERLVVHPEKAIIQAPSAAVARAEQLWNTPIKAQFGRSTAPDAAASKLQPMPRLCCGCVNTDETRPAACPLHATNCKGCKACFGRCFWCPRCEVIYQMRPTYATGSGLSSVNSDRNRFEVLEFTTELEQAAVWLDKANPEAPEINSVAMVAYLGRQFCAACACRLCHGNNDQNFEECPVVGHMPNLECTSVLHVHRDNADAKNSQSASLNRTLSLFAPRVLTMPLFRARLAVGLPDVRDEGAPAIDHLLRHGSIFHLDPRDEQPRLRKFSDGSFWKGFFKHGVEQQDGDAIPRDEISAALVFRNVVAAREVNVETNYVILDRNEQAKFNDEGRVRDFEAARQHWEALAPTYAKRIRPLLERVLKRWNVFPSE